MESVREGAAILRGEKEPSQEFQFPEDSVPDVGELRRRFGLSQEKFAALLGISVGTLRGKVLAQRSGNPRRRPGAVTAPR